MNDIPNNIKYDTSPIGMEPLFPEDSTGGLEGLAIEMIEKAAKLSEIINPITRDAIAKLVRPMNSYYSNLIEGHDTHPIDIEKALNNDYSENKIKKNLQIEAKAHISVHESITNDFLVGKTIIPSSEVYLKHIHKEFYKHLPEEFKKSKSKDGSYKDVVPGEFRDCEVQVGKHIAPFSKNLNSFTEKFGNFYDPTTAENKSKIRRVISIAASHHRLAWIHPFLDGNGRVVRLYSDACFMKENIHASGLWSISRGLARSAETYKENLSNADLNRQGDYDGRGNLSNKMLVGFCSYFLKIAIDQIDYMYSVIDSESMITRINKFVDLMVVKGKLKTEARYILIDVFVRGKVSKIEAMRITNTSDKTLKLIADSLIKLGLIEQKTESVSVMYYAKYPISFSPMFFPGFYPSQKEIDMINYDKV